MKNSTEMETKMNRYLEWAAVKGYSKVTIHGYRYKLRYFRQWCEDRGITNPREVTQSIIERYQSYLYHYRSKLKEGQRLSSRTQHLRVAVVKGFFKWLTKYRYILYNPASEIEFPKCDYRLPKGVLTIKEVENVMNQVNINDPLGIRDRAILETLYSTGMRRMELCNLKIEELNLERGFVMIRQGKFNKDRVVPIGERAIAWIDKYLCEVRPYISPEPDEGILFLTKKGNSLRPKYLTVIAHQYIKAAELKNKGSCHVFRHTMATLMLEGGADTRFIQQMLGHVKLETTQIYTKVAVGKLKEVHTKTHPGATLKRSRSKTQQLKDKSSD